MRPKSSNEVNTRICGIDDPGVWAFFIENNSKMMTQYLNRANPNTANAFRVCEFKIISSKDDIKWHFVNFLPRRLVHFLKIAYTFPFILIWGNSNAMEVQVRARCSNNQFNGSLIVNYDKTWTLTDPVYRLFLRTVLGSIMSKCMVLSSMRFVTTSSWSEKYWYRAAIMLPSGIESLFFTSYGLEEM